MLNMSQNSQTNTLMSSDQANHITMGNAIISLVSCVFGSHKKFTKFNSIRSNLLGKRKTSKSFFKGSM